MKMSVEIMFALMMTVGWFGVLSVGYWLYEKALIFIDWLKGKEKAPCRAATLHSARGEFLW